VINDGENHVILFIDQSLREAEAVSFHPNDNKATLTLFFADFEKFCNIRGICIGMWIFERK